MKRGEIVMKRTKTQFHKLTAWLVAVAMLMTFLPGFTIGVSAAGTTEASPKNIILGTSALEGGQKSNIYFGNYMQSSSSSKAPR